MTNPNNAIGTNGAFDGRTSPNALNDIAAAFTKGIVSGWNCAPKTGMTIQLGGSASVRDVALAENNAGDKLTIDNRSGAPVEVTLAGAPATNNRVDAIVAYVDNPSTGDGTTTDNPSPCGIIAVSGTVAANPTAPTDAQIRSAITTDGATGGVAYYVVLATVLVGTNVTTIGSGVITQGTAAQSIAALAAGLVTTDSLADDAVTSPKIDWSTITGTGSIRLGNILIQYGRHDFGSQSFNNSFWDTFHRGSENLSFSYPEPFASEPTFAYSLVGNSSGIVAAGSSGGGTASTSPKLTFIAGTGFSGSATPVIDWIAIGVAA